MKDTNSTQLTSVSVHSSLTDSCIEEHNKNFIRHFQYTYFIFK
jgi:hypothetical protein